MDGYYTILSHRIIYGERDAYRFLFNRATRFYERSSRSQFSEPSRKDIVSKSVARFGFFGGFDGVRGGAHLWWWTASQRDVVWTC